jgi:hypothetical protein
VCKRRYSGIRNPFLRHAIRRANDNLDNEVGDEARELIARNVEHPLRNKEGEVLKPAHHRDAMNAQKYLLEPIPLHERESPEERW